MEIECTVQTCMPIDSTKKIYWPIIDIKDNFGFHTVGELCVLQYNRESEKKEIEVSEPSERAPDEEAETDEHGRIQGMFGGTCEFCGHAVQPWPTLEQQQTLPPDQLYCCNEYREFVEYTTEQAQLMEAQHLNETKKISITSHPHYGSSKEDRKVAKERALQR